MRLLLCLLPFAAVAATPASDEPAIAAKHAKCAEAGVMPADQKARRPLVHPLTDEPGARQEIAVQRTDANHCVHPIVVRDNVGGTSPPASPEQAPLLSASTSQ